MDSPRINIKNAIVGNARAPLPTFIQRRLPGGKRKGNSFEGDAALNAICPNGGMADAPGSNPGIRKGV